MMSDPTRDDEVAPDRTKPQIVLAVLVGLVVGSLLTVAFLYRVNAIGDAPSAHDPGSAMGKSPGSPVESTDASATDPATTTPTNATTTPNVHETTGSTTPEATPPQEQFLDLHIPSALRATCVAGQPFSAEPTPVFSVVCNPRDPRARQVQYSSFHQKIDVRELFIRDKDRMLDQAHPSPSCRTASPDKAFRWWMPASGALPPHHPVTGTPPTDSTFGRVLCTREHAGAIIEWYDSATKIYAWAVGRSPAALFDWWVSQAGPIHPAR
jgi:hypothetical protein